LPEYLYNERGDEAKTYFDDVCKVKYGVKNLKCLPLYIVVKAFGREVMGSAYIVCLAALGNGYEMLFIC